jgi:hypothetical protein
MNLTDIKLVENCKEIKIKRFKSHDRVRLIDPIDGLDHIEWTLKTHWDKMPDEYRDLKIAIRKRLNS